MYVHMCIMYIYTHNFSLICTSIIIIPISLLSKPRLREANYLAEDHVGNNQ